MRNTSYMPGDYAVFIGRLSHEKGVHILLRAWKNCRGMLLKILGDGPQNLEFRRVSSEHGIKNVEFLGLRSHSETLKMLEKAEFLIMPSVCYETFGLPIIEAFACGKPVIASNQGAMADIVADGKTGLLFTPGDSGELANKAKWLWNHPRECRKMGENARKEYEAKYTPEKNYRMLMAIYQKAIEMHRQRR